MEIIELKLNVPQTKFHKALFDENGFIRTDNDYTEFVCEGAFGGGKSLITMQAIFQIATHYPDAPCLFSRTDYPKLANSVIPQFKKQFKPEKYGYRFLESKREAHFPNGSIIYFRAFEHDTDILSNEYAASVMCQIEQFQEELFLQIHGRTRSKAIPKKVLIYEGNPGGGWIKKRIKPEDGKVPPQIFVVSFKTADNKENLQEGYEEELRREYPESWVDRYVEGLWDNLEELVLSEFKENQHVLPPIDFEVIKNLGDYKHAVGGDYGIVSPSSFIWGYKDFDGRIIIYDEFYDVGKDSQELAKEAKRHGILPAPYDFSTKIAPKGKISVWDDLLNEGVPLVPSNKEKRRNILAVNTMFKRRNIFITSNCVNLINEIKNWKWVPEKIGDSKTRKEEPQDKNDHAIDAMLYLIAYLEDLKVYDPSIVPAEKTLAGQVQSGHKFIQEKQLS